MAAYNEGLPWLEELCQYVWSNYAFARDYLNKEVPALKIADLQATYLMWVNYSDVLSGLKSEELSHRLQEEAKIWFTEGSIYGKAGEYHLRINLATSRATLAEALQRFVNWLKENR